MAKYKCDFCGRPIKTKMAKKQHEEWCPENPESKRKESIGDTEKEEPKITEKQKQTLSSISAFSSLLRSYGIESGEDLVSQIDQKAREMPFYKEITENIDTINKRLEQNSKDIVNLTQILQDIDKKLTFSMQQIQTALSNASQNIQPTQVAGGDNNQPNTEEGQTVSQGKVPVSGQLQGDNSLQGWFDRILKLIEVAGGGGGQQQVVEMPPEIKYKDLIELSQVLKSLQGDPYKQLREDLKLFVNIANAFKTGKVPDMGESESHLEESGE